MSAETIQAASAGRMRQQIELHEIANPLIRRGFDLWQRLRGARRFPTRTELSPRHMPELLRNAVLIRVVEGGEEFQFRVIGDAIVMAQGASFQGMTTHEVDRVLPGYGSALRGIYRRIYKSGEPLAFRGWYEREADQHSFFHETVVLPLGPDGGAVDHIFVVGVYARDHRGLKH